MKEIKTVVLLGAGNVATHLGRAFMAAGIKALQVYSRKPESADRLARELSCKCTDRIGHLDQGADLYVIAVADDAIAEVAASFPFDDKLLVHTSGSTDMAVLTTGSKKFGVLYPLQTFSRALAVDFSKVPLCLEVSDEKLKNPLQELALRLSNHVTWVTSEKRRALHLAAVFACNFVNHMYALAHDILTESGQDFDLLRPLIIETAKKVMLANPHDAQTGPAKRNDFTTINKHLELISDHPNQQKMYNFISESIMSLNQQTIPNKPP